MTTKIKVSGKMEPKKFSLGAVTLASGMVLSGAVPHQAVAADQISIQVFAAEAPNFYGSPSYADWNTNAVAAIEADLSNYGNPTTPAYFQEIGYGSSISNIVTTFNSWNGLVNPTGAFSAESGNRLTFIMVATDSTGAGISLSELTASMSSTDPHNTFSYTTSWGNGNPSSNYNSSFVGLVSNGGGGYTTLDSGQAATTAVNELIVVGPGNAIPNSYGACASITNSQVAISCVRAEYSALMPFNVTTTYTLSNGATVLASGSGTVQFVPEPGTLALFGASAAGLGLIGRRRKKI